MKRITPSQRRIRLLLIALSALFALWGIIDIITRKYDFIADRFYLAGICFLALLLFRRMRIGWPGIILGAVPITLHSIGRYGDVYFGFPFDQYLHLSAGIALGFIFYRYLTYADKRRSGIARAFILAVCITAGLGSFLEIIEYTANSYFGEGGGIFFYGEGDYGEWENATKDMVANTAGAVVGAILAYAYARLLQGQVKSSRTSA